MGRKKETFALGTRVPMGTFLVVGSPKGPHFLPRSLFSLFQAEERAKSESIHYLLNVDHMN